GTQQNRRFVSFLIAGDNLDNYSYSPNYAVSIALQVWRCDRFWSAGHWQTRCGWWTRPNVCQYVAAGAASNMVQSKNGYTYGDAITEPFGSQPYGWHTTSVGGRMVYVVWDTWCDGFPSSGNVPPTSDPMFSTPADARIWIKDASQNGYIS